MKRLYLDIQDPVVEAWLAEFLQSSAKRVTDELQAEVAVLSTTSEDFEARCKTLTKAGCTAFILTPENKGALAQRILRAGGKIITYRQPEDANPVLQRLVEVLVIPPMPGKKEVVAIYSATRAGGSFVAWNLWALLRQQGKKASLCALEDEASPFHRWIPDEPVHYGTSEGDKAADIWIVDASGGKQIVLDSDIALVVTDPDPANPVPEIVGATHIDNRVWPEPDTPFPYIPDLGQLGIQSMHQYTAAVLLNESVFLLFEGLWRYWHGEPLDVLVGQAEPEEMATADQPVSTGKPRCGHDDCVEGFCFHDDEPVPDADAFRLDDDSAPPPSKPRCGHDGCVGDTCYQPDAFRFDE